MADGTEDDELLLDQPLEGGEDESDPKPDPDAPDGDDGDEVEDVTFGDEAAPASGERETDLVKHLRQTIREQGKRIAEISKAQVPEEDVGERPTLADHGFDEDAHAEAMAGWLERRRKAEEAKQARTREVEQADQAWQAELGEYQRKHTALKFADKDEVRDTVTAALNTVQQAVIVKAAADPALLIYAVGRDPAKLSELSRIQDPVKLAVAVAKLEGKLTVTKRRAAPDPERVARGSGAMPGGQDKTLARLEAEADRTGDRTKLIAYRNEQKRRA